MIKVRATAPTRIDLAGGTLDLWPIHHLLDHKMTVNIGVSLNATVELIESKDKLFHFVSQDQSLSFSGTFDEACKTRELPLLGLLLKALWHADLPGITITTAAKSPAGAGLGGSSCLGITLAGALSRARELIEDRPALDERGLIQTVQDVEAKLINSPTGCQDYWGAMRGGINLINFPFGGVAVTTLPITSIPTLSEELILCYSGKSRASAINNWEIFKRLFDGDKELRDVFNDIGSAAEQCAKALLAGDLAKALFISKHEWRLRTRLWPNIETVETKALDQAAQKAGAYFSRVCGAGGGGVMAVFAPVAARAQVEAALVAQGGVVLKANATNEGLTVEGKKI